MEILFLLIQSHFQVHFYYQKREQGTDKSCTGLKLSQKEDVFKRCVARKKTVSLFQSLLNMSFFCSL
jgi:hypothetical protein